MEGRMRNRKLKGKRLGIGILAVTLAALLLITACAPGPPVEEKQVVKMGYIAPLTGPASAPVQVGYRNTVDYLKYFEEVGVPGLTLPPGVTIQLVWADSGYDVTRTVSAYERMRDILFFHMPSPFEPQPLKPRLERDGIAAMTLGPDEFLMYPPGPIFSICPTESERFAAVCDCIMENWEEERPPRVAMMGTDTTQGRSAEVMGNAYAKSIGIEMLPYQVIPHMPLDVTTQLLRLRELGADYVYITATWQSVIPVMRDAERLGLTDEIRFTAGWEDCVAIPLIEALGPVAEGYFGAKAAPWYTETPILYDILREYHGRLDTSGGGACTLQYVPVSIEAIRIAIEEVGYENLDGLAVKEAMYGIEDFDPHDIGRPVTYTPEDHRGAPALRIYEVRGGDAVPVTDWRDAHMLVPEK
jgi:ABC-type branched-subunit amino acid transport system substrate-binding protein